VFSLPLSQQKRVFASICFTNACFHCHTSRKSVFHYHYPKKKCFQYHLPHQSAFSQPHDSQTRVFAAICLTKACFHTHFTQKPVFLLPSASNKLVSTTICLTTACFHYHTRMLQERVREIMFRYMATARDISLLKNFQTTPGARPSSYSIVIRNPLPEGVKRTKY
jgi:hypothetical protein